ncbi:MAG: sulfotransferase family protein [Gemmataceae bacterium]
MSIPAVKIPYLSSMIDPVKEPPARKPREWAPRMWEGADFLAWLRLLSRHRADIDPGYLYLLPIISTVTLSNTLLRGLHDWLYAARIARSQLSAPPVFVIGHWRTGTTLLHELLILDRRHQFPSTSQCFCPTQPLLTDALLQKYGGFLMPEKRPMDNMPAGWERPQEDEFALCLLGLPSTYNDLAFPRHASHDTGSLDLSGLNPQQRRQWQRALKKFVHTIALLRPGRLVLKSPPHTARIPEILEVFPDARFVHIVRDPYTVFASTVKLWLALSTAHGLQKPPEAEAFHEKVFREFRILYERYLSTRDQIPQGHLVEVRYEEFVKDIRGGMQGIYETLGLGDFESVEPAVSAYAKANANYETNRFTMPEEHRRLITDRWGDLITKLGYA